MALLGQMQSLLAALYDAPVAHDVHDYLITDPAHAAALQELPSAPGTDEQLLIATTDDGMELGLYLDASVLERLGRRCPLVALDESNLGDYCTALEGVSHFTYLAWNTSHDRPVSLLELELQAEVDKYVSSLWLLRTQQPARFPRELHHLLFERARVDDSLAGERVGLYHHANRYAARFCRRLERALSQKSAAVSAATVGELRRFYRWSSARKCRHIEQLAPR